MAINSTVWQCEATGRDYLTYAEALKSERRARKKMEMFKHTLRPIVMLLVEKARQSSVKSLHSIIFKFVRRRYFINEEVQGLVDGGKYLDFIVKEILLPNGNVPAQHTVYDDTEKLHYKLSAKDKNVQPAEIILPYESIKRNRIEFSSDNLNMFIKNNVTRIDGILCAKEEAYKEYVTDKNLTFSNLFIGKMPHFTPAKTKKPTEQNKKQLSIKKYVNKTDAEDKSAQKNAEDIAKRNADRQISLKAEMERVRLEAERLRQEKREALYKKVEEECTSLLTKTDDLERDDQRLLPKFIPIKTIIREKLLGDAFMLREFFHSYVSILSGMDGLRGNLNFYDITRAFTRREVGGPLSEIVRILLRTIFDLQKEEEEDYAIDYILLRPELRNTELLNNMSEAARTHIYSKRHFSNKIYDLPLDAMTLSEVLRLHLLSSGACVSERIEKLRTTYRNGYTSIEDPGLTLRMQYPHMLRALRMYTLYQMPFDEILYILRCLMDQILTYSSTINLIDNRMELMAKTRLELRALAAIESRNTTSFQAQKKQIRNEFSQQTLNDTERELQLNKSIEHISAQHQRAVNKSNQQMDKLYGELFNYLVYLGMDRAYRKYYVLESMPGLFIEHIPECYDTCLENPPKNLPADSVAFHADLPKNRKELRSFLMKKYTDEEKNSKIKKTTHSQENQINNNNVIKKAASEDKENQAEQSCTTRANGLTNGHNDRLELKENEATSATEVVNMQPTQYELYMCTGDSNNCIVHDDRNTDRQRWAYIYKEEDINALIEALNPLGERESQLRKELTSLRSLILMHVKKCPVDLLSVEDKEQVQRFKKQMRSETQSRCTHLNVRTTGDEDISDIMQRALAHRIKHFERQIYAGDLGSLKVKDMNKWRIDLDTHNYDPQVKLQWGPNVLKLALNGITDDENADDDEEEEDSEDIKDKDSGPYVNRRYVDPGACLGETLQIEPEDSANDSISLHDSATLRANVKQLASALLQVEQAIEKRFLKEPFGAPLKQINDKELFERRQKEGTNRLKQWEVSLMESTSYSQVFLHLNILHDSIIWARSTAKSYCQICRRGHDPDKMLLCDECNGGTHMFCMKPKLKTVPEGNWYCTRCVERFGFGQTKQRKAPKRRGQLAEEEEIMDTHSEVSATSSGNERTTRLSVGRRNGHKSLRQSEIEMLIKEDEDDQENEENNVEDVDDVAESGSEEENEEHDEEETEQVKQIDVEQSDDSNAGEEEDESICTKCSYDGADLVCVSCKDLYHLECVNLKRAPRYNFYCASCKLKDEKRRKQKNKNETSEEEDTDTTEKSDPPNKRVRLSRDTLKNATDYSPSVKGRRSRRTGDDLPLNSPILYELLEDVMKHELAWPFLRPVMQSEVPDYYDIIKQPMDFAKIKSKLNMGQYQLNEEVIKDIQLIFINCDHYNAKGNEIYEAGAELERFVMHACKKFNLNFIPSDMNA